MQIIIKCGKIIFARVVRKLKLQVKTKRKFRGLKITAIVISVVILLCVVLQAGVDYRHKKPIWTPDYDMVDISSVIGKENFSDDDYKLIFEQTGLTRAGVDDLIKKGKTHLILEIQESFFEERELVVNNFAPFTCCDEMDTLVKTTDLEDGDIIVSTTSHFSFFELGHSALVTDASRAEIINAIGYGNGSDTEHISNVTNRHNMYVLRPKLSAEKRKEAAQFAKSELIGLPYSVSVGILQKKFADIPLSTHCGHIVWYSYMKMGIDIDSNGGATPFPRDFITSDEVEILQVYGVDPRTF